MQPPGRDRVPAPTVILIGVLHIVSTIKNNLLFMNPQWPI
jgi:hypothetical protein